MNLIKGFYGIVKKEIIRAFRVKDRNFEIKLDNFLNFVILVWDFYKNLFE